MIRSWLIFETSSYNTTLYNIHGIIFAQGDSGGILFIQVVHIGV
jgi:hypothetical protein